MSRVGGLEAASDEELVAAFSAGDTRAFDLLVDRYAHRVFAICYRYFGNAADAEDAAQDAFVALLRRGHTFSGASAFSTWMYRVARNACNDLARKRARRPQSDGTDVGEAEHRLGAAPAAEDALADRDLDPALVAALRELDPDSREAVILHDLYGYPYADIAARSGVALGTVKSRIHRAHARLATALRPSPTEPSNPDGPPT